MALVVCTRLLLFMELMIKNTHFWVVAGRMYVSDCSTSDENDFDFGEPQEVDLEALNIN